MTRSGLLAGLLVVAGCDGGPLVTLRSETLPTGALTIFGIARSNGALTQIVAGSALDSTGVELTGEDALFFAATEDAAAGDPGQRLTPLEGAYIGQIESDAVDFDLVFQRARGARFVSPIELPPAFTITTPAEPAPRSAPMTIAWDPTDGPFDSLIEINGPCLSQGVVRRLSPDPGSFLLQPPDLFVVAGSAECDLEITVTRAGADTALAPELAPASRAQTQQIRTAAFLTVP